MSVKVGLIGGLGNNLFQYCLGRIIAEHHGFKLECVREDRPGLTGAPAFEGASVNGIEVLGHKLFALDLCVPGRYFATPIVQYPMRRETANESVIATTIDLPSILRDRAPRQIRLNGFFQRFEYYSGHGERIKQWLQHKNSLHVYPAKVSASDVLVSIRRGDYDLLNWSLPLTYYVEILSRMRDVGRVYVGGIGVDDHVRTALKRFEPIYVNGSAEQDFSFFKRFSRLVLSNSTFAWWAAYLSDATEIYAPRSIAPNLFGFTGFRDVDLHMREPRYREINVGENSVVACEYYHQLQQLIVKRADGRIFRIDATDIDLRLVKWLIGQNLPILLNEFRRLWGGTVPRGFIIQLVESGLVAHK